MKERPLCKINGMLVRTIVTKQEVGVKVFPFHNEHFYVHADIELQDSDFSGRKRGEVTLGWSSLNQVSPDKASKYAEALATASVVAQTLVALMHPAYHADRRHAICEALTQAGIAVNGPMDKAIEDGLRTQL